MNQIGLYIYNCLFNILINEYQSLDYVRFFKNIYFEFYGLILDENDFESFDYDYANAFIYNFFLLKDYCCFIYNYLASKNREKEFISDPYRCLPLIFNLEFFEFNSFIKKSIYDCIEDNSDYENCISKFNLDLISFKDPLIHQYYLSKIQEKKLIIVSKKIETQQKEVNKKIQTQNEKVNQKLEEFKNNIFNIMGLFLTAFSISMGFLNFANKSGILDYKTIFTIGFFITIFITMIWTIIKEINFKEQSKNETSKDKGYIKNIISFLIKYLYIIFFNITLLVIYYYAYFFLFNDFIKKNL